MFLAVISILLFSCSILPLVLTSGKGKNIFSALVIFLTWSLELLFQGNVMIQGHYGTTDSLFLLSSYSFCMTFCELPNMSDPNAEFLQQYKQVCLKSPFQLGVKCNLTFFFCFCFSLHCNCSWKVVPISQSIQCKNFFFLHFFSDKGWRLKTSYLETICRGQFFIINLDDKTKLSYPSLPFRTDAKAQFL